MRSSDPSPNQPPVAAQPGSDAASDDRQNVDKRTPEQLTTTAHSEKYGVGRQEEGIERALIAKSLAMPPAIVMLDRTPSIAIRGKHPSVQSFTIVSPLTTVVDNDRPTFSWTALSGATSYTVSVFDTNLHLIKTSGQLHETQWSMLTRLASGIKYTWIVTALKDGQEVIAPAPPARAEFKILGEPELRSLKRMVSRTTSHAARGVLYAEAALLDEAEKEFQTHLKLRPADERVKRLLRIVQSWRCVR
jgi:hypothetical protein